MQHTDFISLQGHTILGQAEMQMSQERPLFVATKKQWHATSMERAYFEQGNQRLMHCLIVHDSAEYIL